METEEELCEMTVMELRQFLERQEVSLTEIGSSGRTPRPLKRDLLEKALEVRRRSDLMRTPETDRLVPMSSRDNLFQRSSTEKDRKGREDSRQTRGGSALKSEPESEDAKTKVPMVTPEKRSRRQSWIDSGLFGAMAPTPVKDEDEDEEEKDSHDEIMTRSKTNRKEPVVGIGLETPPPPPPQPKFEDMGSGSAEEFLSDDWSDDAEEPPPERELEIDFSLAKVADLKDYLDRTGVPYDSKARKAELIALAKAQHTLTLSERKRRARRQGSGLTGRQQARSSRRIASSLWTWARRRRHPLQYYVLPVLVFLGIVGTVLLWRWYDALPFCDMDQSASTSILPSCKPCPPHAVCNLGDMYCEKGFLRRRNHCVEDHEIRSRAQALVREIENILRDTAGRAECGESVNPHLSSEDIMAALQTRRISVDTKSSKFKTSFEKALLDVSALPDIDVRVDSILAANCEDCNGMRYRSRKPLHPFSCLITRFLRSHIRAVVIIVTLLGLSGYISLFIHKRRQIRRKVEKTYREAVTALQEARTAFESDLLSQPYVIDTHLRDDILSGEKQKMRIQIWELVEKQMSYDTRILKTGPKVIFGVPCLVWEWKARLPTPKKQA